MIPYADFEMALARWKARKSGTPMPSEEIPSGAVASEIPSPNDEAAPQQGSSTHIEISDYDPTPRPADN